MTANDRQDLIRKLIEEEGVVRIKQLAGRFNVSGETVRRDLIQLEKNGFCVRVRGGATRNSEFIHSSTLAYRVCQNERFKREIGRKALKFINEGDIIGIDSGSTAAIFAEAVKETFSRLIVVTYSLGVFEKLKDKFKVILCGGMYDEKEAAFFGKVTVSAIQELHTQKFFLMPSAISLKSGICEYHQDMILVQQAMYNNTDRVFCLADNSKFEKNALYKLSDISGKVTLISDNSLSNEIKRLYLENNIRIY